MRLRSETFARWMLRPPVRRGARMLSMLWYGLYIPVLLRRLRAWQPSVAVAAGLLSALLTLQTLRLSSITADWHVAMGFLRKPLLFGMNWLPIAALLFALLWLTGRLYLAYALTAAPMLVLTLVNYYKLLLRGDPLLFADISLVSEAKAMTANYTLRLAPGVLFALVLTAGMTVFLYRKYRGTPPPSFTQRAAGCGVWIAAVFGYMQWALPSDALYSRTGLSVAWMPTQSYVAHGVVYPFLRSMASLNPNEPEGYDAQQAAAVLAAYPQADIPEAEKVNIIAIMLEAYGDFSKQDGLTFENDPYADMHALMAESYAGELVVNVFAGETINTERAFLTGYLDPTENFRAPVSSFVWYLRAQGYKTSGSHPGNCWFYNRLNVNRYLGFESYDFYENRFRWYIKGARVLPDTQFLPTVLMDYHTGTGTGAPLFSFHVTYQNHGPYATTPAYDKVYLAWRDGYNEADYHIANNSFAGLAKTGRQIKLLAERFAREKKPVVLVVFGDHMPWWGDGNSTYQTMGVNIDRTTEEGFFNYFSTPYLIWANDAAKTALNQDFVGDGGRLGASFLMQRLFTLAGWDGPPYMQALRELETHTPFVNRERWMEEGALFDAIHGQEPAWLAAFRQVEYLEKTRTITEEQLSKAQ